MTPSPLERIFLYGPPGVGKTTLGAALATALALPFLDLDAEITARSGQTPSAIFAAEGEAAFRAWERRLLTELVPAWRGVLSLGGGTLLDPDLCAQVEAAGRVLYLHAAPETLAARLAAHDDRPLLQGESGASPARLTALLDRRAAHYAAFPARLEVDGLDLTAQVAAAQRTLGVFRLGTPTDGYPIFVADGTLTQAADWLESAIYANFWPPLTSILLVSDGHVAPRYAAPLAADLARLGVPVATLVLPPGERTKRLPTITRLWEQLAAHTADRRSLLVALGGGVITDLVGFAAATYLRGIRWLALPTSLLGMNDAAIGAKTGIDLPQGKNLAGAFYPPLAVLADTATLATLPPREFRSGMAEVIKHGLIADPELLAACRLGPRRLPWSRETLVRRAAAVKIAIVRRDPFEAGERAALNAGHTVGHAIEVVSRYRIGHGPAVALGLVAEARLAERLGLTPVGLAADLADTFRIWGLGVKIPPGLDRDALLAAMQFDKKRRGKQLYLALPAAVGQMIPQVALPDLAPLADILRHDPLIN